MIEAKKPWGPFLLKATILSVAILAAWWWVSANYRVGIDGQAVRCLPDHKYYLVDLKDKSYSRGEVVAYYSAGLEPHFPDGTLMAKFVRATSGDKVVINESGVRVNGDIVEQGFALSKRLGTPEEEFYREFVVPEGKLLMLAPAPESYDGRYWGLIDESQLAGAVVPLI